MIGTICRRLPACRLWPGFAALLAVVRFRGFREGSPDHLGLSAYSWEETALKRTSLVVVIALVAAASVGCGNSEHRACQVEGSRDPAYTAQFEEPPRMGLKTHMLLVHRDGEPVSGARVCLNVEMVGMSWMAGNERAREIAPGRYEVSMDFEMAGPWEGTVLIEERGNPTVEVPVRFDVMSSPSTGGES